LRPVARRRLLGATILLVSTGCQLVLGDFTVEGTPSPPAKPLDTVCAPNTYLCSGNQLQTCSDDRSEWKGIADCASADQCDPTAGTCRTCAAGEFACNGATLQTCDATGHWQPNATPCDSPELCHVAVDRKAGTVPPKSECAPSPCPPGNGHSCTGNRLERCSDGRDQLLLVDRCGSAALCDVAKADGQIAPGVLGTCQPPTCHFGQFACDGATLERCNDDQNGWTALTTCPDATSCNPLTGDCTPCAPNATACSGSDLLRCGTNGFAPVARCKAVELCNAALGRCDKPACSVAGALRCTADEPPRLEECGNDLRWNLREACAGPTLCSVSAGRCLPPACELDDTRCVGQELQRCGDDRSRWVVKQTCSATEVCDPSGCLPAPCTEANARCNNGTFERCVSGTWVPLHRCGPPKLCNKDQGCLPPECDASHGDYSCNGAILVQCTAGIEAEPLTCSGEQDVCDPDLPGCVACQPFAYECKPATELHRCLADGSASPLVMNCPGGCRLSGSGPVCAQMP
jgi:hypothetical protein